MLDPDLLCYIMLASVFDKHPHHLLKHFGEDTEHRHSLQSCCMVHKMCRKIAQQYRTVKREVKRS